MALTFFNTLGRKLEEFKPLQDNHVRMYTCGPTVYDYPHIGNHRTFVFEDILRKYLKFKGYKVTQVMNLTDVDDKTITGSQKDAIPLNEYTAKYSKAFFEDLEKLRIERAEFYPKATDFIDDMVTFIKKLIEKHYAYTSEGSVYFDITKFKNYGKLSGLIIEQLKSGARVKVDEYKKEDAQDFALWKAWDSADKDVFWQTNLGKGRPGWHIECSVMSTKLLGETFDIHAGGVDLIFPHHENEIAQSEALTGKKFVKYWLHSEHLIVEGQKMSKSLGNFYTLRQLIEMGHDPIAIRYLLISAHYRAPLNFTFEGLKQATASLKRLQAVYERLESIKGTSNDNKEFQDLTSSTLKKFEEAMDADLNTPLALAALFDYVRDANRLLDAGKFSEKDRKKALEVLQKIDSIFSVMQVSKDEIDKEIEELIAKRNEARAKKDWALADKIRTKIYQKGFILEDTPAGTKGKKVSS
ncbi:MAG: cysteine--tRNA ligase [Thaumarchaeota archaeon]|nr:cysteine--tRNA ligase [Nitrososphaerota archaeon]